MVSIRFTVPLIQSGREGTQGDLSHHYSDEVAYLQSWGHSLLFFLEKMPIQGAAWSFGVLQLVLFSRGHVGTCGFWGGSG